MAKISTLDELQTVTGSEFVVIDDGTTTSSLVLSKIKTFANTKVGLSAPSGLTVPTPTTDTTPTWSWNSVSNATSYQVSLNDGPAISTGTNRTYTPSALSAGSHTLKVRAMGGGLYTTSAYSSNVTADIVDIAEMTAKVQEGSSDQTDLYSNHHPTAEYLPYTDRTYAWVRDTYSTQGAIFIARAKDVMPARLNAAIQTQIPSFNGFTDAQVSSMLTDSDGSINVSGWVLDIQYQDFTYGHTDSLGWHGGFNVTISVISTP